MPTVDKDKFNPRYFTKYFTKNLAIACGVVAISTFNYAFDQQVSIAKYGDYTATPDERDPSRTSADGICLRVQGFNSTQAMTPFDKAFGEWIPATSKTPG